MDSFSLGRRWDAFAALFAGKEQLPLASDAREGQNKSKGASPCPGSAKRSHHPLRG